MRVRIATRKEYEQAKQYGFEPLIDSHFDMNIKLRVELQREIFGKGGNQEANQKFYKWVWAHKPHYCEECLHPLYDYSATFVSHILPRGGHPEMAVDPRNVNILCASHHHIWELREGRTAMRIYLSNLERIDDLINEYKEL